MENILAFLVVGTLAVMVPGPDFMIVTRNALVERRLGIATALGIASGLSVHATLATIGLSAIILASATAFTVVKLIGAAYLGYVGLHALMAALRKKTPVTPVAEKVKLGMARPDGALAAFRQGILTNVLNPKVVIFFMSFVPQFIPKGHSVPEWTAIYGLLQIVITFCWFTLVALMVHVLRGALSRPNVARGIEGTTGLAFLGFGTRLVLEHR